MEEFVYVVSLPFSQLHNNHFTPFLKWPVTFHRFIGSLGFYISLSTEAAIKAREKMTY